MDNDGVYILVTWGVMLLVLPLFVIVFAVSLVFVSPVLVLGWLVERWSGAVRVS